MRRKSSKSSSVIPILYDSYIAFIKNSVGSRLFRNFYARVDNKKRDVLKNGELSCAIFVSSILVMFNLLQRIHGTVTGTVKDLKESGWTQIKKPRLGSVIIWEPKEFDKGDIHKHIGFYIGSKKAISNDSRLGYPIIHNWTFGSKNGKSGRKIETMFWNKKLG